MMLAEARSDMLKLLMKSSQALLGISQEASLTVNEKKSKFDEIPQPKVMSLTSSPQSVVVVNSLPFPREEIVSLRVDSDKFKISCNGNSVPSQLVPVWESPVGRWSAFDVYFRVTVPPLGIQTCHVTPSAEVSSFVSEVTILHSRDSLSDFLGKKITSTSEETLTLSNGQITVRVSTSSGLVEQYQVGEEAPIRLREEFLMYKSRGGAYLFLPVGPAVSLDNKGMSLRIIKGPIVSQIVTGWSDRSVKLRTLTLFPKEDSRSKSLHANLLFHHKVSNHELVWRFSSDIISEGLFHTDLNGFQHQRRKLRTDLPINHNFYPITTSAFLEGQEAQSWRMTLLSSNALAAASLVDGQFEVIVDRFLEKDDERGLGQVSSLSK